MAKESYDLTVIGGGPGGYVAAIRAAQLGLKTLCVDKRGCFGGVCLNVGCIPSKALLKSSEKFVEARQDLAAHGVMTTDVKLDLDAMMKRKDRVVSDLTKGIEFLFKKNGVTSVVGTARLEGPQGIALTDDAGKTRHIETAATIIATGSEPTHLPGIEIDETRILSSTGALSLNAVPREFVLVGAGYIGLEMGSVWSRLGAKVTVIEFQDRLLPGVDGDVAATFGKILARQGFSFRLGTKIIAAKRRKTGVAVTVEPVTGGAHETITCDVVLLAAGRRPYTEGLGLQDCGVEIDDRGFVTVDENFQTKVRGIYAIGDCIPGPMLAHKAEEEGAACAEIIAGQSGHVNYEAIPSVIYTTPEVASVGKTEEQLKASGTAYKVGTFPFSANGRARCNMATQGFVKILADAQSDRVLGAHILGDDAGALIAEIVTVMEFGGSAEDVARTCHAHPTLSESVKEAALDVAGRAIHI